MLIKSNCKLDDNGIKLFKKFNYGKPDESEFKRGLSILIEALYKHYNRKVIIILDEYYRNLMNLASVNSPLYKVALALTKDLLSSLKLQEEMLQLTIFIGRSKVVKSEIFTELNHFQHESIMGSQYPEFFGFTESDDLISRVIELKPDIKNKDIKKNVKDIYDGYSIKGKIIYNP